MEDDDPHQRVLVSTKGVLRGERGVLLVKNARSEWELPGGKLEHGERPEECLEREIREELGIPVTIGKLLAVFRHHRYDDIMVIVYECDGPGNAELSLSDEHSDVGWFDLDQIRGMHVPETYRQVILSLPVWAD
ncbi:MAG: NUDIX hydrolase [Pseudomonadales bacterium]|jgi:mutator protein MutT